jgi:signal transduction histidine kinase
MFYSFTVAAIFAIISGFLIYILKTVSKTQLQQIFSVNLILMMVSFLSMFLQIQFSEKFNINPVYFEYFSNIGLVFLPVSVYFTSIVFVNTKIKFKARYLLFCIIPLLSLVVLWTNDVHHLFFETYSVQLSDCEFGTWFYICNGYSIILYAISIIRFLNYFKTNLGIYTQQISLIVIGSLFPFLINLLGIIGIIDLSVYVTPISIAISLICFAIALFKFQLLNTLPIALTKIVNRISDGYIVLNDKNIITDLNDPFKEIFNISHLDIKQSHIFDLLAMEEFNGLDEDTIIKALKAVVDSNETLIFEQEFQNIEKFLRLEINSIKSDGVFIGALILIKDLTQHHKDLESIKASQNILIEKERLASLGQMIGGIAHNMKTPIFSISGAAEGLTDLINEYKSSIVDPEVTIEDHLAIAKDMETWIEKIKSYAAYMSDIITAVRGQAVALTNDSDEIFTIEELVKRVDILMKHELKSSLINLKVSIQTDKNFEIKGNINSLVQVINNLISNAIQSYNGKPNEDIDLTIFKENKKLIITISDNGCGMSDEVQEKLFKEMVTTKGKNGTGLGLFMSYSNIKAQFNGDLKFTSEEGKGTTFNLIIPIKN